MSRSMLFSAMLHLAVVLLLVFGVPQLWEPPTPKDGPMIVEVVEIAEKTTAKEPPKQAEPEKKVEKKEPPPPPEPPKAPPKVADLPPPPSPPKVEPTPAPEAEKVPEPEPQPKPEKKAEKEPEKKKPEKKPEPKAPPKPPQELAQMRPRDKPPVPKEDFLKSVLRDVAPEERTPQPRQAEEKPTPDPAPVTEQERPRRAELDGRVTTSEIDAIRHQIEKCWVVPVGARDAESLVVSIRVWLNPDGTVREARIDRDRNRVNSDPFFRAAAESAMRAVLNDRCQPLPIPSGKYEQFKELVLNFNPKEVAGS